MRDSKYLEPAGRRGADPVESVDAMTHLDEILSVPGITANSPADMVKRLSEGWKMIRATVETIRAARAQGGR